MPTCQITRSTVISNDGDERTATATVKGQHPFAAVAQATALLASSEALRKAVSEGRVAVVPAVYDLASGVVGFLPPVTVAAGQAPAVEVPAHHAH